MGVGRTNGGLWGAWQGMQQDSSGLGGFGGIWGACMVHGEAWSNEEDLSHIHRARSSSWPPEPPHSQTNNPSQETNTPIPPVPPLFPN